MGAGSDSAYGGTYSRSATLFVPNRISSRRLFNTPARVGRKLEDAGNVGSQNEVARNVRGDHRRDERPTAREKGEELIDDEQLKR